MINEARIFVLPMFAGGVVNFDFDVLEQADVLAVYELVKDQFFFYPAQFWSHKNHINLLHAFKEYLKENKNCKLVFTGSDKGNQSHVQQVVKDLQLQENVKFLGFVDNRTLYSLYKNAIALVFPSLLGPTNMPLLEAFELDCKVICSDLKGHREQLHEYALYFNPLDKNDIFKKMQEVNSYKPHKGIGNGSSITKCCSILNDHFLAIKKIRNSFGLNFNQF
jgi:glycosyltransferase involved in cell wall biosynthesis